MISVIVPAHNEEAVIGRHLQALLAGAAPAELEIVVACNGCTDGTAAVARRFGPAVKVCDTPTASKAAALNLGDQAVTGFPRFYLDADVVVTVDSLRTLAAALADRGALAASPRPKMDLAGASWAVRAYYEVWLRLPYVREGLMGAGAYGLSRAGRTRFGAFPQVIADDGYIRQLFGPGERICVAEAVSIVQAPRTLADLVRTKTRSRLGRYQLRQRFPELGQREAATKAYGRAVRQVLLRPHRWLAAAVYVGVNLLARWRAKRQLRRLDRYVWERDDSSRQVGARTAAEAIAAGTGAEAAAPADGGKTSA